jgi:hypothetical protein
MNAITFIVIIGVLWAVRELAVGIVVRRSRRKYRHEYRVERTQSHFAAARNELMRLAVAGEVDVNSRSFQRFYYVNTAIMRRPDQYSEISRAMVGAFLSRQGDEPDEQLSRESKNWSPAFRDAVKATAHAMDYIILDYSRLVRFMFWLERLEDPESNPHRMLSRVARMIENKEKEKTLSQIRRTQKVMYTMAGAHA